MDLRITDLENFVQIATARTMREGADSLGITQPALSESIKRLEKDLGEILFYRSRSGIALTPGGRAELQKAQEALSALNTLGSKLSQKDSRLIAIGCHPTIASYFLPKAFRRIQAENPYCQFRLVHDLSRKIQLEVQRGSIDVAIVVNAVASPDVVVKTIARDEVGVWHSDRVKTKNSQNVFCNLSLTQTQSILRKWKDKPSHLVDTDSLELIARFVSEGLGYGILPARTVSLLGLENCEKIPKTPIFNDTISVVHRPEFGKHPTEKIVLESLKQSII